jgi:hypothetical protein
LEATHEKRELLDHFINTVLPMEMELVREIPTEPQLKLSVITD